MKFAKISAFLILSSCFTANAESSLEPGDKADILKQAAGASAALFSDIPGTNSPSGSGLRSQSTSLPENLLSGQETAIRDEIGLPPGSTLGVVDTNLRDGPQDGKTLRVAFKSRPGVPVDTREVKIHVFFYEQNESGKILLTESKVVSQWISPPVNWAENEPELLDVTYTNSPRRQYAGFIVGVYYKGKLQDTQADPGSLARTFPLPLNLKQEQPTPLQGSATATSGLPIKPTSVDEPAPGPGSPYNNVPKNTSLRRDIIIALRAAMYGDKAAAIKNAAGVEFTFKYFFVQQQGAVVLIEKVIARGTNTGQPPMIAFLQQLPNGEWKHVNSTSVKDIPVAKRQEMINRGFPAVFFQ